MEEKELIPAARNAAIASIAFGSIYLLNGKTFQEAAGVAALGWLFLFSLTLLWTRI